jgi:Protein of unknown function (DUF3224)
MTQHVSGLFEVKMQPQPWTDAATPDTTPGISLGRLLLDKQYRGDLQASAKGQMLSAAGTVKGSAGYVAIEVVTGTLQGKSGSFALMHRGVMDRGTPELRITVVPDSGTGELQGLAGQMGIEITEGRHHYTFDYTLP